MLPGSSSSHSVAKDRDKAEREREKEKKNKEKEKERLQDLPPPGVQYGGTEAESHFVLRAPTNVAEKLKQLIRDRQLDEKFTWQMNEDGRTGKAMLDGVEFTTKLVDLPCIIESHKTFDSKQFYKIADISQMLILEQVPEKKPEEDENEPMDVVGGASDITPIQVRISNTQDPRIFRWKHGLTPPMKNVRRRRFRKKAKRIIEDVEIEVNRLLQADELAEIVKTKIEVEDANGEAHEDARSENSDHPHAPVSVMSEEDIQARLDELDEGEGDNEGEIDPRTLNEQEKKDLGLIPTEPNQNESDSEGEEEGDEGQQFPEGTPGEEKEGDGDASEEESDDDNQKEPEIRGNIVEASLDSGLASFPSEQNLKSEKDSRNWSQLFETRNNLKNELAELENLIQKKEAEILNSVNVIIKQRFEGQLKELNDELDKVTVQLQDVENQLSSFGEL